MTTTRPSKSIQSTESMPEPSFYKGIGFRVSLLALLSAIGIIILIDRWDQSPVAKLERRAYAGELAAQKELTEIYLLGKGVPVNHARSYAWHCIIHVQDPKHFAGGPYGEYLAPFHQEGERLAAELWQKVKH